MSDTDTVAAPATENSTDEPEQQSDAAEEPKLPRWKALLRTYSEQQDAAHDGELAPETTDEKTTDADGEPTKDTDTSETESAKDAKEEPKPPSPEVEQLTVEQLKELASSQKYDEILKALGVKKPEKVASRHWADFRQKQQEAKREHEEAVAALTKDRTEVERLIKDAESRFAPFAKAKKLWEAGDIAGATQEAFGVDPDAFASANLKQKLSRDPVQEQILARQARLEKELQDRDERDRKALEERETESQKADQQRAINDAKRQLAEELGSVTDGDIRDLVVDDDGWFCDQAFHAMAMALHQEGEELTPEEAAERARDQTIDGFKRMPAGRQKFVLRVLQAIVGTGTPDQPATPDQDGSPPASKAPKKSVSHQKAQQASPKRPESYSQLKRRVAREMRQIFDAN